jgi:transcriptional regulator with XRE-family HTH domain
MNNVDSLVADKLLRIELANIRKSRHLTQKQLSEISGLSEACISNIESGENSSPTLRSLIKYISALDLELYINQTPNKNDNKVIK